MRTFAAALLITLAFGCAPAESESDGWLKLLVVNDVDGTPVENARIDIQAIEGTDDGRTHSDGRKELRIEHGVWALEVHGLGFKPWGRDVHFMPGRPDFTDGIVVRLEPIPARVATNGL
jgi:hypothetical protein